MQRARHRLRGTAARCTVQLITSRWWNAIFRRRMVLDLKYPPSISRKLRKEATEWRLFRQFRTPELRRPYINLAAECRMAIHSHVAK